LYKDMFVSDPLPTVEGLQGSRRGDRVTGSSVANSLYGDRGNDKLFGLEDNDLLHGGDGEDDLDGGLGLDTCRKGEQKTSCELPLLSGTKFPGFPDRATWLRVDRRFGSSLSALLKRMDSIG
jgi:hypothetical protein